MRKFAVFLIALITATLACSLTPDGPNTSQVDSISEEMISTAASATITALSGQEEAQEDTLEPQATDTAVPQATDAPVPDCQPLHPGPQAVSLPAGVALASATNQEMVSFYDLQANLIGTKTLSGIPYLNFNQIHLAGGYTAGFADLPVVYHAMTNGNELLRLNINNSTADLGSSPSFVVLTGAEAQPFIAYSLNSTGPNGWIRYLYASEPAMVKQTPPLITRDEGDGYAVFPLAVHYSGGSAQGIWYTETLEGIGNINFAPHRGLFYYNLLDSSVTSYLPSGAVFAGLSPDQTWAAYHQGTGDVPGQAKGTITVKNLITCEEMTMTFAQPDSLGGWVEFSPDNQYVSWLETFGPSPMDSEWRVRVSKTTGMTLVDAELDSLTSLTGGAAPEWIAFQMKWVDNHLLGLTLKPAGASDSVVVLWAPDPAQPLDPVLGANQSVVLANGRLIGLLYP